MLKRDSWQEVAETARVGILILIAPDELQGTVLEHADRQIKEKMVMLLDARGQLKDSNAMDIGYGRQSSAISMWVPLGGVTTATAVAGLGHIANECPTPKGKEKGKEDRNFYAKGMKGHEKGKGKSAGGGSRQGKRKRVNGVRSLWEARP